MRFPVARLIAFAGLAAGAAWGQLTVTCVPADLPQLIGTAVSVTCTASGGTGPYAWSIGAGALPQGVSQDPASGNITGTLIDPAGPYSFMVTATDTVPPNATGSQAYFGLTVDPMTVSCVPNTGPVEVGVPYSSTCTAAGGTQPYSWSFGGTAIPPGITVTPTSNPATVSLLPLTPMPSFQYYVIATDSSLPPLFVHSTPVNGAIVPAVSIITAPTLPAAAANGAYVVVFAATSGFPPYSWSATGLPTWLTLSAIGVLTGTPPSTGPVSFNVSVTDGVGGVSTGLFTLPVNAALTITTTSPLPSAVVGTNYSQTFAATGGDGVPYTWSAAGLPTWLTMSAGGVLTGIPPASTINTSFAVTVRDSSNNFFSQPFTLPVTLTIATTSPLPAATIGVAYNQTFIAGGGSGGDTWSATGLPSWLTLSSGGVLTGVPPSSALNSTFTVKVTDSAGVPVTGSFTVPVTLAMVTTSTLPPATVNTSYSQTLAAQGGAGGYTWSATGLPSWLTLTSAGVLAGIPPSSALNATFTVKVTDSAGASITATTTVPVIVAIATTSPLPTATVGSAYSDTFAAVGGAGGYTWSATGLPAWLTLSTAGVLNGTPQTTVPANFSVTAKDSTGTTATSSFTLPVNAAPLAITTTSPLANGTTGVAYSQTIVGTGGVPPYTWSVSAGALPNNLGLNAGSGVISGTPTVPGNFTFTIHLADSASTAPATKQFTITIANGLTITTTSPLPPATAGSAYTQTFGAAGGAGGYTWSATGLPTWLTLTAAGVLAGTPPAPGPVNFNVTVKDSGGTTSTSPFTLPVNALPLAISTNSALASGTIGVAYSQTLAGTGGVAPYTWSVTTGALPNSLGLNGGSGVISGTPTAAGTFTFTIQLSDSASSAPVSKQFTIAIASGLIITTAPSLPNATAGVAYSQTLQAVGGTPPYTWSITQGALPTPLSLNPSTGAITGAPAAAGTFTFTVQVSDSHAVTSTKAFTLIVVGGLSITTASLPNGTVGAAYSQAIAASGGVAPYSWSIVAGSSPAGTSLNPTTGTLSGTPTSSASFTFTVQVTDSSSNTASKPFTVVIASGVIITTAPALPTANVGIAYSQSLAASGGTPPYSWGISSGSLPPGLALSNAGVISGTPTGTATASFAVQVTDSTEAKGSKTFTLSVVSAPAISTASPLAEGEVGVLYSQTLTATGGAPPYTWSVSASALPGGLTLSPGGVIGGTPAAAGTFTFTVQVNDSSSVSAAKALVIAIAGRVGITTPSALSGGSVGAAYSQALSATAGLAPYSWTLVSGALPGGLKLAGGGVISGSPTAGGTFTFTARVTDSAGATASQQFTITIATGLVISSAPTLPGAVVGTAYSEPLHAAGGTAPYTWLASGSLPAGLSLAADGLISGTPTTAGTFSFTAQVTDSVSHQTSQQMSIAVELRPVITTSTLPNGVTGVAYSQPLAVTGGTAPVSWSITTGALPAGLSLSATGAITGTPSAAGTFTFTVQLTDSFSVTAAKQLSITVASALSISTAASLPPGAVGASYSQTLTAVGGAAPYTWTLTEGSLPAGLSLGATGTITGTPTTVDTVMFTLQVKGSTAATTASQQFTLVIVAGLTISTASLPSATAGAAYSQSLKAVGGLPPYNWTIAKGALPAGLALNASSGLISGTPTVAGNFTITAQVNDTIPVTASQVFTLVVASPPSPAASFTGLQSTTDPLQQLTGGLSLGAKYPLDITGELTLTFHPDAVNAADDPSIQFSTGGRTLSFTIPHGTTTAVPFSLQTGSVAGTITLSVTWQAGGITFADSSGLVQTIQIARAAPVITAVTAGSTSGGLQLVITGYSNTREVAQAVVQFTAASGQTLQTNSVTVPLTDAANTWFQAASSDQYGSQFILTLPFTVSSGSAGAVASVSVTLTNSVGTSNSMSAGL